MSEWPATPTTVDGVVVRGHEVASGVGSDSPYPAGTIGMQLPRFADRGLDLTGMHPATINVDIAPRGYAVRRPTHTFRDVRWTDLHGPETFSFFRCRLARVTTPGAREVEHDGWIYYPHPETKPMHEQPSTVLEVLMPYLAGLAYGDAVRLSLDPDEIRLE